LAWWMKERYGSTMNQALKTVLPVKAKIAPKEEKIGACGKLYQNIKYTGIHSEKRRFVCLGLGCMQR
ncbi:MAG: hypothetical protein IJB45_06580, partial [Clostridia bacterium]|nr:hypothetical protein [Clostridia bacterium]